MRSGRRLLFLIMFLCTFCHSQDSLSTISYRFGITKLDFFTGIEYAGNFKNWRPFGAIEFGVNRTIFQQRVFPKVSAGVIYSFKVADKFNLGPMLHYGFSLLRVNASTDHFQRWNEVMGGLRLEIGSKWRFIINAEAGLLSENYFNQVINKYSSVYSWGYTSSIALARAI